MPFHKARHLAKKHEQGSSTERPSMHRDGAHIRNPRWNCKAGTAGYAEAVVRFEEDIIPMLETAARKFFYPGGLNDDEIRCVPVAIPVRSAACTSRSTPFLWNSTGLPSSCSPTSETYGQS